MKKLTRKETEVKLNDKTKGRIHLIYGIVLSAVLVILGILFMCSCYGIYQSGSSPFTRESIGEAFSKIAIPTYLTISLVIIGAAINVAMPKEEKKLKGIRTPEVLANTLAKKVDVTKLDTGLKAKIEKERRVRRILANVRAGLITASAILPLFVLLNPANFPAESGRYNAEILHGMLLYLAFLTPLAIFEVVWVILRDKSYAKENEALKEAVKAVGVTGATEKEHDCLICKVNGFLTENKKPIILGVRIALVGCALLFIVLGIVNGGMADVLNKAIKICTECIGLG